MKLKRAISLTISLIMMVNLFSGCALKDRLINWKSKDLSISIDKEQFKAGWDKVVEFTNSTYGAVVGNEYVNSITNEIQKFANDVNKSLGSKRTVASEAGFIAEKWEAATYNIDALVKGSKERSEVVGSNGLGSVDVKTSDGQTASSKYYKTASGSAQAQALKVIRAYNKYAAKAAKEGSKSILSLQEYLDKNGFSSDEKEILKSIYDGQIRIIPSDQLEEAKKYLTGEIKKLSASTAFKDQAQAKTYQETLDHLRDRLISKSGKVQSTPVSYEDMQAISELAIAGEFKPEDFGLKLSQIITSKYLVTTALKTGATTALIGVVLTTGPDLYKIIVSSAKGQDISAKDFKKLGIDGLFAGSESFIVGSVSCALTTLCKMGVLGATAKNASPALIGALTVLAVNAIKYGYSLTKGTINLEDYGNLMAENVVTSIGFLSGGAIAEEITTFPMAILVGGFAGSMLASIGFNISKNLVMEAIDGNGFAAFVPEDTVKGVNVISDKISRLNLDKKASEFKTATVTTLESGKFKVFNKRTKA